MAMTVTCSNCGQTHKVNERLSGRAIHCPGCDTAIVVPQTDATIEPRRPPSAGPTQPLPLVSPPRNVTAVMNAAPSLSAAAAAVSDEEDDDLPPPRKKRDDGELDMTPMVDVTFLLLIFFMVTASFSLQKSIQMPRQNSEMPSASTKDEESEDLDAVEMEIDEFGGFLVMAANFERETPGKINLIAALQEAIGENREGMELKIRVHENAKLQFLVDAMDAGTIAGFTALQVTQVDGFD